MVTITPFGLTGPYAGYRAHHLVSFHAGGEGSILPSGPGWQQFPERPPIQVGADLAEYDAGWNAAVAVLAAMYDRLRTGRGQRIDVSIQESEFTLNRTRLSRFNNDGIVLRREGSRYGFMGMMRCRDGWVQLVGVTPAQWDALAASPDAGELADPKIATADRPRREHGPRSRRAADLVRSIATRPTSFASWRRSGVPWVRTRHPPTSSRRSNSRTADSSARSTTAAVGEMLVPGPPYRFSATPVEIRSAPTLGSATGFARRTRRQASPAKRPRARGRADPRLHVGRRRPVRHLPARAARRRGGQGRVHATPRSGPARLPRRLRRHQPLAELQRAQPRQAVVPGRPLPARGPGARPSPRRMGRRRRRQLPPRRHGPVRSRRRDASSPSAPSSSSCRRRRTASTGPEAMAAGLASIFGATGGLSEQTGYADGPPTEIGESTDYRSGSALAVAVLAALLHRARTGEGQHVDLASREVVAASSPDALLAEQLGCSLDDPRRQPAPRVRAARRLPRRGRGRLGRDRGRRRLRVGGPLRGARPRGAGRRCIRPPATRRAARVEIDDAIARMDSAAVVARGLRGAPGRGRAGDGGDDERVAGDRSAPGARRSSSTSSTPSSDAPASCASPGSSPTSTSTFVTVR